MVMRLCKTELENMRARLLVAAVETAAMENVCRGLGLEVLGRKWMQ